MWKIKAAKCFRTAFKFYDRFFSYCFGGLAEVLRRSQWHQISARKMKTRHFRPALVLLEDLIVPTVWPTSPYGVPLVTVVPVDNGTAPTFAGGYGTTPLRFDVNQGQADADAKFTAYAPGYQVLLSPTDTTFVPLQPNPSRQNLPGWTDSDQQDDSTMTMGA